MDGVFSLIKACSKIFNLQNGTVKPVKRISFQLPNILGVPASLWIEPGLLLSWSVTFYYLQVELLTNPRRMHMLQSLPVSFIFFFFPDLSSIQNFRHRQWGINVTEKNKWCDRLSGLLLKYNSNYLISLFQCLLLVKGNLSLPIGDKD